MQTAEPSADVIIIGTGVAGLIAGREIQRSGRSVMLLDKGRGLGGRLATRRVGDATFDHGAQFITTRDPYFEDVIRECETAGVITEWCKGFSDSGDGHTRWRGQPSMTALPKYLAQGLNIRMEQQVVSVRESDGIYSVETKSGDRFTSRAVVLTPPVPQSLALIDSGDIQLDGSVRARLEVIEYERCIAVMAVLEGPSSLPTHGGFVPAEGVVSWIADNQKKGVSREPAVTIHGNHEFSLAHWDGDRMEAGQRLIDASQHWIGAGVKSYQVHGWRFSKPMQVETQPCIVLNESPLLVIAGDAFSGPRVEGAALSGVSAAREILSRLNSIEK